MVQTEEDGADSSMIKRNAIMQQYSAQLNRNTSLQAVAVN